MLFRWRWARGTTLAITLASASVLPSSLLSEQSTLGPQKANSVYQAAKATFHLLLIQSSWGKSWLLPTTRGTPWSNSIGWDNWSLRKRGAGITKNYYLRTSSVPMRRSCWDISGEQGNIWVLSSWQPGMPHPVAQSVLGHLTALRPQGTPLSPKLQCHLLSFGCFYPVHLPSPYRVGPGPQQKGLCGHRPPTKIANPQGHSQLLESSSKDINSCCKDCGQSCQTTVNATSLSWKLISEK